MNELLEKRFDVAKLFAKALAGELDEKETQQLEAWLRESPRHVEEWNALRQEMATDKRTLRLQQEGARMAERRWRKFKEQTQRGHGRRIPAGMRYAAALLVPLLVLP